MCRSSSSVDLGAVGTCPTVDDESRSTTNPAPVPVIVLEENLVLVVGEAAKSLAVALMQDVIGSLQDVAPAAPQTTASGLLPEAVLVEELSTTDVLGAISFNSKDTEAP